jgi:hypothetical protein
MTPNSNTSCEAIQVVIPIGSNPRPMSLWPQQFKLTYFKNTTRVCLGSLVHRGYKFIQLFMTIFSNVRKNLECLFLAGLSSLI